MTCIIIEDQPPAQRILKKYLDDYGRLELKAVFFNAIDAIDFLKREVIDVIFLDIHLPKISGIDFLKTLPNPPHVILTTAFPDYALESYDFDVVDYLLKPFSFQRFIKALSKIPIKQTTVDTPSKDIFIKSGYEHIKVNTDQILYIKSDADYTELYLLEKKLLSSEPLRHWLETLDNAQFVRSHKSYIVHISKIEKVMGNQIYLAGEHIIPIGRAYKEGFAERVLRP